MVRYLVSGRYTAGPNEGRQFLLMKGGYVVGDSKPLISETSATEAIAKAVATRKNRQNAFDSRWHSCITPCCYSVSEINY